MATEIPSSHRPWLFDEYQARLETMAARGGERDREVEAALAVLTPRELDVVYYVHYDLITVDAASRMMSISRSVARKYYESALRKVRIELEPLPEVSAIEVDRLVSLILA